MRRRSSRGAGDVLLRRGGRRSLENAGCRPDMDSDLRPRRFGFGRRPRDRPVEFQSDLRRHRADPGALRHRLRRRRLSLRRRRHDLAPPRARADARDRPDPGRLAQPGRGARGGARPHLRSEPRTGRLPDRGRRKELEPCPLRRRAHGRGGPRRGSRELRGRVRVGLAGQKLSVALLLSADGRPRQRTLQILRRGADVEAPRRRRLADRRPRPDRTGRVDGRPRLGPRRRGERARRRLDGRGSPSVRRRGGDVGARQRDPGPRVQLHEPPDRRSS